MIIISEAGHLTCREPIEFQFDYLGGPWENWVSESCQMGYKTWPNIVLPLSKCMGFSHKGLWGMAYHRFMGYGVQFPANQVGGSIRLWDITGYGLCQVWVKAGSTVCMSCVSSFGPCTGTPSNQTIEPVE